MNSRAFLRQTLAAVIFLACAARPAAAQTIAEVKAIDDMIAAGEQFLKESGETPEAIGVRQKIAAAAFQRLTELRKSEDWIGLKHDPDVCRYAKVALLSFDEDLREKNESNLWVNANLIGEAVMGHAPPNSLEDERAHWRKVWKSVESLEGDLPPWEFIELSYHVRQQDAKGMRHTLAHLAQRYPKSHANVWWGTKDFMGQPAWKVRLSRWLKLAGDPEWKTWEPSFEAPNSSSLGWDVHEYDAFLEKINPAMPQAWDHETAPLLVTDKISLESERLEKIADRIDSFRPLLSAGGFMWICQPAPVQYKKPRHLLLASLETLKKAGDEVPVKLQSVAWPPSPTDDGKVDKGPVIRSWATTIEQGLPAVWIGTEAHGLARFDLVEGEWKSRWYSASEDVGMDILMVRPCLHAGKPKLLILSQGAIVPETAKYRCSLWTLDPADGGIREIVTNIAWHTQWFSNEHAPRYQQFVAVWKDGGKVPLRLYARDDFLRLDVEGITDLERIEQDFVLLHGADGPRVWGASPNGLTPFDGRLAPRMTPDGAPLVGDLYYFAPGTRGRVGVPGATYGYNFEAREREYHTPLDSTWQLLQSPPINPLCSSSNPEIIWSTGRAWPGWVLLSAYKPAGKAPVEENDAWHGPWRTDMAIQSLDLIDGYLWLVTAGGNLHRFRPETVLLNAEERGAVRTTAAWRPEFYRRVEAAWQHAVRKHIVAKEYDQALSTIAQARREMPKEPTASDEELDLWEALIAAQQGDSARADRLYNQLAENPDAIPFLRGIALFSLANLRYSTQDWLDLKHTLDRLTSLFPSLNAPMYSCRDTIDWYREQASKGKPKR